MANRGQAGVYRFGIPSIYDKIIDDFKDPKLAGWIFEREKS